MSCRDGTAGASAWSTAKTWPRDARRFQQERETVFPLAMRPDQRDEAIPMLPIEQDLAAGIRQSLSRHCPPPLRFPWNANALSLTKRPPLLAKPAAFPCLSSSARPVARSDRIKRRASRTSAERLLPAKAIRRDHALENEITRHRITSFRFVEHAIMMGCRDKDRKMPCRKTRSFRSSAGAATAPASAVRARAGRWWRSCRRSSRAAI